jgi:hypothetical protein
MLQKEFSLSSVYSIPWDVLSVFLLFGAFTGWIAWCTFILRYWTDFVASRQNRSTGTAGRSSCYTFGAWLVNGLANTFSWMAIGANKSPAPSAFRRIRHWFGRQRRGHRTAGSKLAQATAK